MILPELIGEQRRLMNIFIFSGTHLINSIKSCKYYYQRLERGAYAKRPSTTLNGKEVAAYGRTNRWILPASNIAEAFTLNFNPYNLAFGKNVIASSSSPSRSASLVADGGAGSRWESDASDSQWIYVDLGKKEKIVGMLC